MTIDINLALSIAAGILLASFIKHVALVGLAVLRGNTGYSGSYDSNRASSASSQNVIQK